MMPPRECKEGGSADEAFSWEAAGRPVREPHFRAGRSSRGVGTSVGTSVPGSSGAGCGGRSGKEGAPAEGRAGKECTARRRSARRGTVPGRTPVLSMVRARESWAKEESPQVYASLGLLLVAAACKEEDTSTLTKGTAGNFPIVGVSASMEFAGEEEAE